MNVLITGAGGFLGNELIRQLLKTTHVVYALSSDKEQIKTRFSNKCHAFSIKEWEDGELPLDKIDVVIHCAFARAYDFVSLKKSLDFSKEIFSNSGYNIINVSSRSVYGQNPQTPWCETTEAQPDNMYAFAKYTTELLIGMKYNLNESSNYTNIRLAGLVGKELEDRVINKFIDVAISTNTISIKGGKQQFAYLDVRDAAAGIIALLDIKPEEWKTIYNLGNINSFSIIDIAETVKEIAKEFIEEEVIINIEKTDATLYADIDSTSFYEATNWKPKYDLKAMVRSIFKYKIKNQKL